MGEPLCVLTSTDESSSYSTFFLALGMANPFNLDHSKYFHMYPFVPTDFQRI